MSSGITAVVTHYWDSRDGNLEKVCLALLGGSVTPDRIIVWDNSGGSDASVGLLVQDRIEVVTPTLNHGCIARFVAATLARTPWVLTQDNDLMVERGTLENMMKQAHPFMLNDLEGRVLARDQPQWYRSSTYVNGKELDAPARVDVVLGRLSLFPRVAACDVLAHWDGKVIDDDILSSHVRGAHVIPYRDGQGWVELPDGGVGLSLGPGHHDRRDALCRRLFG